MMVIGVFINTISQVYVRKIYDLNPSFSFLEVIFARAFFAVILGYIILAIQRESLYNTTPKESKYIMYRSILGVITTALNMFSLAFLEQGLF